MATLSIQNNFIRIRINVLQQSFRFHSKNSADISRENLAMICWLRNSFYLKNRRYLIMLRLTPCQTRGSFQNQENHELHAEADTISLSWEISAFKSRKFQMYMIWLVIDAKSLLWKSNLNLVKFRPLAIHGRLFRVAPTFNKWTRTYYKTLLVNCLEMQGKWSDRIFYVFIPAIPTAEQCRTVQWFFMWLDMKSNCYQIFHKSCLVFITFSKHKVLHNSSN